MTMAVQKANPLLVLDYGHEFIWWYNYNMSFSCFQLPGRPFVAPLQMMYGYSQQPMVFSQEENRWT